MRVVLSRISMKRMTRMMVFIEGFGQLLLFTFFFVEFLFCRELTGYGIVELFEFKNPIYRRMRFVKF